MWLLDIHLLAASFAEAEWKRTLEVVEDKRLSGVVLRGIERAHEAFGVVAPSWAVRTLREAAHREPTPGLLIANSRTIDTLRSDLAALTSWRARLQLLQEHLFPPRSYMKQIYAHCPSVFLPLTYVYRIVRGAPKWFKSRALD